MEQIPATNRDFRYTVQALIRSATLEKTTCEIAYPIVPHCFQALGNLADRISLEKIEMELSSPQNPLRDQSFEKRAVGIGRYEARRFRYHRVDRNLAVRGKD